jgi:hypothetical protein
VAVGRERLFEAAARRVVTGDHRQPDAGTAIDLAVRSGRRERAIEVVRRRERCLIGPQFDHDVEQAARSPLARRRPVWSSARRAEGD